MAVIDPSRVRKFNGRLFMAHKPMSKRDAVNAAKRFRTSGYYARMTKDKDGYIVWTCTT